MTDMVWVASTGHTRHAAQFAIGELVEVLIYDQHSPTGEAQIRTGTVVQLGGTASQKTQYPYPETITTHGALVKLDDTNREPPIRRFISDDRKTVIERPHIRSTASLRMMFQKESET